MVSSVDAIGTHLEEEFINRGSQLVQRLVCRLIALMHLTCLLQCLP